LNDETNISGSLNCIGIEHSLDNACNDVNESMSWKQEDEEDKTNKDYPVQSMLEEHDVHTECSGKFNTTHWNICAPLMTNLLLWEGKLFYSGGIPINPKRHGFPMIALVIVVKVMSRKHKVCVVHAGMKQKHS